ncbi:DUF4148 domain-containing protein [Paraburkholderia sp. SOS3]|jgi:hypothetical protein|uniref:DUF4148 domain-containing protein n=1 Tax=Paraburkholderia sp. SOS3 TaxID=1926494 RepID=UPI00094759F3|nr:DUF4148 domain-containing protein [Paraburkholderia sp. SOS3]APR40411.1 hypothetical protein BTO02_31330 [Paraburkholderia sp. SOS3]
MKPFWIKTAATLCVLLASGAASASKLTPGECNDYPFKPLSGAVTHAQLMQELSELESVGYDPSAGGDDYYPSDIEAAQARLAVKYRADCLGENVKVPKSTSVWENTFGSY